MRTIIEEDLFRRQKSKLRISVKRLDEILEGITWALSKRPEAFHNVPGTNLHLIKTDPFSALPALHVWYKFDDECVYLLSIEKGSPE